MLDPQPAFAELLRRRHRRSQLLGGFSFMPILCGATIIITLALLDIRTVYEHPRLFTLLNTLFLALTPFMVAGIAASTFRTSGNPSILLLGCGMTAWGFGGLVCSWLLGSRGPNAVITVYNSSALLGAAFHAAGASLASAAPAWRPTQDRGTLVSAAYLSTAALVGLIFITARQGLAPLFIVQGMGHTPTGRTVLISTIVLFAFSSALCSKRYCDNGWPLLRWYSLGLALVTVGLTGIVLQKAVGSPIGWVGRLAQYAGTLYILTGAAGFYRNLRRKDGALDAALNDAFLAAEERYRALVEEATDDLVKAERARGINERRRIEDAKKRSESRLNDAQSVAQIGSWETSLSNLEINWSDETFRIFELDPASFLPTHPAFLSFVHPEDRAKVEAAFTASIAGDGSRHSIEHRIVTADGRTKIVEERWRVLRDGAGQPVRAIGTCQDITARKQTENALHDSELKYRTIFEQAGDYILLLEIPKDGPPIIRDANAAAVKMHGYSHAELIGQPITFLDYVDAGEDAQAILQERLQKILASGAASFEVQHRRRDGSIFTAEAYLRTVVIDSTTYAISVERNITERKRAQTLLLNEQARLKSILEAVGSPLFVKDNKHRIILANRATYDILGLDESAVIGKTLAENIPESEMAVFFRVDREVLDTGIPDEREEALTMNGLTRTIITTKTRFIDHSGEKFLVCAIHDITERKKSEEALLNMQKLESLGVLAGGIAHDFNNILTSILGNISLLKLQVRAEGVALELINEAQDACTTAKGLSRQLLTFAKGGSPIVTAVDLSPLITHAASFATRGSNARCIFDLGEAPLAASIDKDQITQVIGNLVINASQAMPHGGDITIRGRATDLSEQEMPPLAAGRYVVVTVADMGSGIAPEHLSKIFDPYFTTKAAGQGLGLSVCYSIMAKHGGLIRAESKPGAGSVFTLYFPALDDADISRQPQSSALTPGSGRVLVIDDDATVSKVLKRMLESLGYTAKPVADGQAALDAYAAAMKAGKPYDAVIMDLTIPGGMGGKETLLKLLALDPHAKAIVSSGYSDNPVMADYKAHGFGGALTKPYKLEDVCETLRKLIGST